MSKPIELSTYFVAKCYAAYYNSPAYKQGRTIGVTATLIDNIHHFGTDGWKLKLWPLSKMPSEHARRLLEMSSGHSLGECKINVINSIEDEHPQITIQAIYDHIIMAEQKLFTDKELRLSVAQADFLRGFYYDIGFSHLFSLIQAGIGIDASLLIEPIPLWEQSVPRTFKQEYVDSLMFLDRIAKGIKSPQHIGILNALIGAEMIDKSLDLFLGMKDIINKLANDSDEENQRINN